MQVLKKGEKVKIYYPILEWTDDDVERFIEERDIKCAPVYYDEAGIFHVERRLGCIGCPLSNVPHRIKGLRRYPGMVRLYVRGIRNFFRNKPDTITRNKFDGDPYKYVLFNIFFEKYEKYEAVITGGLFPEMAVDAKQFLEDYFAIDLTLD